MKLQHTQNKYAGGMLIGTSTSFFDEGETRSFAVFTPNFERKTLTVKFVSNGDGTGSWIHVGVK